VHGNRSPVSAWVALIAVAAMLGVGLAGATFIRLEGQGEVLDTWGAPVVTFTLAYSAVVGALAGALAGLLLLVDPSRLVGGPMATAQFRSHCRATPRWCHPRCSGCRLGSRRRMVGRLHRRRTSLARRRIRVRLRSDAPHPTVGRESGRRGVLSRLHRPLGVRPRQRPQVCGRTPACRRRELRMTLRPWWRPRQQRPCGELHFARTPSR
jgi:hypothetical protein